MTQNFIRCDWSTTIFVVSFLLSMLVNTTNSSNYDVLGTQDKGLPPKYLISIHNEVKVMLDCFLHCIKNCYCVSFEITNQVCELYNSSKVLSESEMKDKPGTMSYVFGNHQNMAQCVKEASFDEGCCSQLKPCKNGGTCIAADPLKTGRRYKCLCKPHTKGVHCEIVTPANFCQDELNTSKKYNVYDLPDGQRIYCKRQDGIVWTMVMWCSQDNCGKLISLSENHPISYWRLSLEFMKDIQKSSRIWKVGCYSKPSGYIIGHNSQLDILSDHSTHCVPVEEYGFGEEKCVTNSTNQCKIQTTQEGGKMLYFTLNSTCSAGVTKSGVTTLKCGQHIASSINIVFGV